MIWVVLRFSWMDIIYNQFDIRMRKIVLAVIAAFATLAAADDSCPESKQITCVDEVREAYEPCKKAAESGGSDLPATLKCLKYYSKMRTDCWPCICLVAKDAGLHVQGCDQKKEE